MIVYVLRPRYMFFLKISFNFLTKLLLEYGYVCVLFPFSLCFSARHYDLNCKVGRFWSALCRAIPFSAQTSQTKAPILSTAFMRVSFVVIRRDPLSELVCVIGHFGDEPYQWTRWLHYFGNSYSDEVTDANVWRKVTRKRCPRCG